ncbi:MAG: type II toxin-antitoxin system HipA family toxin [Phoenicibacter congonensis]|uniref:Type II toxin-antitoxin system HipA family toxin n=1 Tax=Phoenicibacter congonensis TaxID=1944646 RepID=A0AA43UB36_9ACTN|nr:type II toxin-antitoxin system HipA family toxin [Phoenicibacter congonensis]
MHLKVTITHEGTDVHCGDLYTQMQRGRESAMFRYSDSWLTSGYALSPDLPLTTGSFSSHDGFADLRVFQDCMPDRWGRNLLDRDKNRRARETGDTPRTLGEVDYLIGVSDVTRQGAIRVWGEDGQPLSMSVNAVPREVDLPNLLDASDLASEDLTADVQDLVDAGSSLGGARPKATIRDASGNLYICKLPKTDEVEERDVCAWEYVAMQLSEDIGINVMPSKLLRIGKRSVLITKRFDRDGAVRIPYISGMSAISGNDGGRYSLLDLVDFIEQECARPEENLRELWLRALFTCAIGNTDNHMRNYGFLRQNDGWVLAPQFDVNPTMGNSSKMLASAVDANDYFADVELVVKVSEFYRVPKEEAIRQCGEVAEALSGWQTIARKAAIDESSIAAFKPCFEAGIAKLLACASS